MVLPRAGSPHQPPSALQACQSINRYRRHAVSPQAAAPVPPGTSSYRVHTPAPRLLSPIWRPPLRCISRCRHPRAAQALSINPSYPGCLRQETITVMPLLKTLVLAYTAAGVNAFATFPSQEGGARPCRSG